MSKRKLQLSLLPTLVILVVQQFMAQAQQQRSDIDPRHTWDLTPIYESNEAWSAAKEKLVAEMPKISSFKGTLAMSATNLLACLEFTTGISKEASRLYVYSSMNADLDARNMKYSSMEKELQQIFAEYSSQSAFINPEILSAGWEKIEKFIQAEPKLKVYEKMLKDLYRGKEHTLSEAEERIMALSGMVTGAPYSAYSTFSDAEMPYPRVVLSSGDTVTLNSSGYSRYRAVPSRADRELVFSAYWNNYAKFKATFGELLYANVKGDIFSSKARNYGSSLDAALFPNNIPVEVYKSLIENVNKNLPAFHRYLGIKKRMMGVDTLKYLDLYAPVVKDVELTYTYDQAKELVLKSLAPLGSEYTQTVQKAFDERWIDVYPTLGKRSGAYSNGSAYDVHPYILLNYNNLYDDVSTLTHELGHTMHSYFSNKAQPYPTSHYTIFVAEVASTFNEVLLFNQMMKEITDDDTRLSLLMEWLDSFKGTLFRQTQFAEYELLIHETAEKGQPLTGDLLSETYLELAKRYYGHDKEICYIDDNIAMEWAFIPHFYYNYYVYQYSTSFTASISLAERVLNNEQGALGQYMAFLSSGGSDFPIELLKKAGVDMTTAAPFDKTIASMNAVMDEIEKILDKKEGKQ
ncbi:MAG: oligoendopeptidase F [Bacteroidales bacterium]|nr:oligoendopeptidase F [Bacteroidales bacterium]